jgi:hypothetical protein
MTSKRYKNPKTESTEKSASHAADNQNKASWVVNESLNRETV